MCHKNRLFSGKTDRNDFISYFIVRYKFWRFNLFQKNNVLILISISDRFFVDTSNQQVKIRLNNKSFFHSKNININLKFESYLTMAILKNLFFVSKFSQVKICVTSLNENMNTMNENLA